MKLLTAAFAAGGFDPGGSDTFHYTARLAAAVLLAIFATLFAFIRSEWGFRILQASTRTKGEGYLEPMV